MTFEIVVVCSANVCRSPMTAALLRQAIEQTPLRAGVEVSSCGEHARGDLSMCRTMLDAQRLGPTELMRCRHHHPAQLTADRLLSADLVLTAGRATRASVARLEPRVHERTFTLREAAALARHVVRTHGAAAHGDPLARLDRLVIEMNDNRGLIAMPTVTSYPRTVLPWPRLSVHGYDVPDAHADRRAPHRITLGLLGEGCAELARALNAPTRYGSG